MPGQWGGARQNSGPKPRGPRPIRIAGTSRVPNRPAPKAAPEPRKPITIPALAQERARHKPRPLEGWTREPFAAPVFPPSVSPGGEAKLAFDEVVSANAMWANSVFNAAWWEGIGFLGYTYLSELAQRPEYRAFAEIVSTEMTRKWIAFKSKSSSDAKNDEAKEGGDKKDAATPDQQKLKKIAQLEDELDRLNVRGAFQQVALQDSFFGRTHIFIDTGTRDEEELKSPIGDGRNEVTKQKVKTGGIKGIKVIEPLWCYPTNYNSNDPMSPLWYAPDLWVVMSKTVHSTRLLTFVGREVPDLLKPAYAFGGLSMSQMAKPYVDNWIATRQSVADIIQAFTVFVLETPMAQILQEGGEGLFARAQFFNNTRANLGLMMIDKGEEGFQNVSAPLGSLDALQAQTQEHMASVSRIPLVKLLGIQPAGLNASSEGEIRTFYDWIAAFQNKLFRPGLTKIIDFAQVNIWGAVDPDITFEFEPLYALTEKEAAEVRKVEAETGQIHVDTGVISPEEERRRIAEDPSSAYHGLDPDDVPDLAQEEADGLVPGGKKPGGEGGEGGGGEEAGGFDSAPIPFPGAAADAASFREEDHPRAPGGQFGPGGGGPSGGHKSAKQTESGPGASLMESDLKKVGKQMGSNPGGVFEDKAGKRFYVKRGKTPAHVRNELAAAALYRLAGAPVLNYRPVEGGNHIATEMAQLDKSNAKDLSPAERKQAAQDFVTHAWLGNWDAVGTGGDNIGTVGGVPTSLDLGGALSYRAQGAPKGEAFGPKVGEIDTMRDQNMSPDAARMFGKMTPEEMRTSAERVTKIPDAAIRETIEAAGEPAELAEKLIARKSDIAKRFALPAMDETDSHGHEHAPKGSEKGGQFVSQGGGGGGSSGEEEDDQMKEVVAKAGSTILGTTYHTDTKINLSPNMAAHVLKEGMASEVGGGANKNKKTAFGGLWKAPKAGESESINFNNNVAGVLAKPANAGTSYRQMLAHMIKNVAQHGAGDMYLEPLKKKLLEAWQGAYQKLVKQSTEAKTDAESLELHAQAQKVAAKLKEMGAPAGPPAQWSPPAAAPAPAAPKPAPPSAPAPSKASPDDLKKAAKATNVPVPADYAPAAKKLVEEFNAKYGASTAAPATQAALEQKVADWHDLKAKTAAINQEHGEKQAAAQKKKNQAATDALKQQQEAAKEKNKTYMAALGISEVEATGFDALVQMHGAGSGADLIEKFKGWESQAKGLGYPISGFQYALIRNYIDGGYHNINKALRAGGSLTAAQHVYAKLVNSALDKLPKFKGTVTRGTTLSPEAIANYVPGHVIEEKAFTSTGIGFKFSGNVHYTIQANGHRSADFSTGANTGEKEVLFKAHTFFVVHKVEKKGGVTHIHMEEVEGHG